MAYCTQADLEARFGKVELAQLTDDTAGQTAVDAEVSASCDEASSLIDGYLAAKYALPLSVTPTIIRKWACDIARKYLWKDRATDASVVSMNYEAALAGLRDLAKGTMVLPDATGTIATPSAGSVVVIASDPVFSDDVLGLM